MLKRAARSPQIQTALPHHADLLHDTIRTFAEIAQQIPPTHLHIAVAKWLIHVERLARQHDLNTPSAYIPPAIPHPYLGPN